MSDPYEDEYEDDDEDLDGYEERGRASSASPATRRGLALGFLALVPLLVAYELGQVAAQGTSRSSAELLLFYVTSVFGARAELVRWAALGACALWALAASFRNAQGVLPSLFRQVVEGGLAALVLGPTLIGGLHLADSVFGPVTESLAGTGDLPPLGAPGIGSAARVCGAAAYEELLFRLGAMSILFLAVRSVWGFLVGDADSRALRFTAEGIAVVGSALIFAAFHLETFTGWLGPGGEPWDVAVFTWRALAGMLLAVLFRWRGIGVAAWAHGLFNLALVLGAGPDVFL